jgi:hypothetical protein
MLLIPVDVIAAAPAVAIVPPEAGAETGTT